MQNELNYLAAFYERDDVKDLDAISKQLKWLEDRGAVKLKYVSIKYPDGHKIKPVVESVTGKYPELMEVHNKWMAFKATQDKVRI